MPLKGFYQDDLCFNPIGLLQYSIYMHRHRVSLMIFSRFLLLYCLQKVDQWNFWRTCNMNAQGYFYSIWPFTYKISWYKCILFWNCSLSFEPSTSFSPHFITAYFARKNYLSLITILQPLMQPRPFHIDSLLQVMLGSSHLLQIISSYFHLAWFSLHSINKAFENRQALYWDFQPKWHLLVHRTKHNQK